MRRLAAIIFATYPLTCFAFELKLNCSVESTYTYSTGRIERNAGIALVEITDYGGDRKIILVSSAIEDVNQQGVSTIPSTDKSIFDYSDSNKWHIINKFTRGNRESTNTIIIDRNTGILIIDRIFQMDGRMMTTQISGRCEKIDPSRKKF